MVAFDRGLHQSSKDEDEAGWGRFAMGSFIDSGFFLTEYITKEAGQQERTRRLLYSYTLARFSLLASRKK